MPRCQSPSCISLLLARQIVYKKQLLLSLPLQPPGRQRADETNRDAELSMRTPASLLRSTAADNPCPPPLPPLLPRARAEEQQATSVDSDTVVILASLLCALICVAGLALVARCTCRRRSSSGGGGGNSSYGSSTAVQPPRGLKKAAIEALPTVSLEGRPGDERECAICLAAFAEGDELRVLPHCAHGFHAACIDTWLGAHASCPSCRATVVTCRRCGAACCDLDVAAGPEQAPPLHPS